ncbi:hypothetical protein J3U66_12400 [Gilliamella sp. B2969]|uniref:hypothetical protein n=1 Tax=Gilliamella sp. B2969 TaxID=2818021 RepID=UPI00226A49E7|nr:hypothetical protein [Gilliamella sp. B2969]MCX8731180.1 hypothetical protein [Gilliamella sp. B2969]
MSKKYIKLIGPVFHNYIEYTTNSILSIPDDITESEADRLIKLGAAKYETVTVVFTKSATKSLINDMTKKQCQEELTAAGIVFDKKLNLAELQKLVSDHRTTSKITDESDDDEFDINTLTREQLELELTARAIEFTAEQSEDELRQLLIDDESDNDE